MVHNLLMVELVEVLVVIEHLLELQVVEEVQKQPQLLLHPKFIQLQLVQVELQEVLMLLV